MSNTSNPAPCFRATFSTDHGGRERDGHGPIELTIERCGPELVIHVQAPYFDDPAPSAPPGPTWGLWNFEVVELFFVGEDERYTEIELSPHGHHLVIQLHGVRNIKERLIPIDYESKIEHRGAATWSGTARIPLHLIASPLLRFNAFAIHAQKDDRTYMALYPGVTQEPDFHQIHSYPMAPKAFTDLLVNDD